MKKLRVSARRRKKTSNNRSRLTVVASKEWDRNLDKGDFVTCGLDLPAIHVYKIVDIRRRQLYAEDLFNHPSLAPMEIGDEYSPLVLLRLYRTAPSLSITGASFQEKVVDGYLVHRLDLGEIEALCKNLAELKEEIDATPIPEG